MKDIPEIISTGLGDFSKVKFQALVEVRAVSLEVLRTAIKMRGYKEVSLSTLVNVAGSCENPYASFTLPFYGREAHLSQSAQLQLEALVLRLRRSFFTVNNSFREEHFEDPEAEGRRLSEFTLIEPERPFEKTIADEALVELVDEVEQTFKRAVKNTIDQCHQQIFLLGGDLNYLSKISETTFNRITYSEALEILHTSGLGNYSFGFDLGIKEERKILEYFNNVPTFITHFPSELKFFNIKQYGERNDLSYSVDLIVPRLGETVGGGLREEDGNRIKEQLINSKVGRFLKARGEDPLVPFSEYFRVFEDEKPMLRGGYGIGFERFIGFLLNSNDILNTIAHRILRP